MSLDSTIKKVTIFLEQNYNGNSQLDSPANDPIGKNIHHFLKFLREQRQNNAWITATTAKIEEIKQQLPQDHILKVEFIKFLDQLKSDLEKEYLRASDKLEASIVENKIQGLSEEDSDWTIIKSASNDERHLSTQSTLFASVPISDADASVFGEKATSAIDIPESKKSWWPIPGIF